MIIPDLRIPWAPVDRFVRTFGDYISANPFGDLEIKGNSPEGEFSGQFDVQWLPARNSYAALVKLNLDGTHSSTVLIPENCSGKVDLSPRGLVSIDGQNAELDNPQFFDLASTHTRLAMFVLSNRVENEEFIRNLRTMYRLG